MNDEEYRKEIGRRAEIEKHFADGGTIEIKRLGMVGATWSLKERPIFNWDMWDYRKAKHTVVTEFNPYEGDFVIWYSHNIELKTTSLKGLRGQDVDSIYVRIPSELVEKFR